MFFLVSIIVQHVSHLSSSDELLKIWTNRDQDIPGSKPKKLKQNFPFGYLNPFGFICKTIFAHIIKFSARMMRTGQASDKRREQGKSSKLYTKIIHTSSVRHTTASARQISVPVLVSNMLDTPRILFISATRRFFMQTLDTRKPEHGITTPIQAVPATHAATSISIIFSWKKPPAIAYIKESPTWIGLARLENLHSGVNRNGQSNYPALAIRSGSRCPASQLQSGVRIVQ
ncbi:MAG: hypothetical protein H7833_09220 [Magnetococcus sp. DMHC-1]